MFQDLFYEEALLYFNSGELDPRILIQLFTLDETCESILNLADQSQVDTEWQKSLVSIEAMGIFPRLCLTTSHKTSSE